MDLREIAESINKSKSIAIMGHKNGDSDCYGAAFGLAGALEKSGKKVSIVSGEDFPESLGFLFFYFSGEVVREVENVDLLIILDASDLAVVSDSKFVTKTKESGVKIIQIDHHTLGDLHKVADLSFVDPASSSVSEIIFNLLLEMGMEIDKNVATCLLTGIIGDTSSFQNQNTSKETFSVASELMKRGARLKAIINNMFGGKEVDVLKVWGLAMERLNINEKYGAVTTYLTFEDIESYGLSYDAISGIVNFLNSIKGARVIVLVTEEEKGFIKVSLRTRDEQVDVSKIARQLGGGGHVKAAGFSFAGSFKTLTDSDKNNIVII